MEIQDIFQVIGGSGAHKFNHVLSWEGNLPRLLVWKLLSAVVRGALHCLLTYLQDNTKENWKSYPETETSPYVKQAIENLEDSLRSAQ